MLVVDLSRGERRRSRPAVRGRAWGSRRARRARPMGHPSTPGTWRSRTTRSAGCGRTGRAGSSPVTNSGRRAAAITAAPAPIELPTSTAGPPSCVDERERIGGGGLVVVGLERRIGIAVPAQVHRRDPEAGGGQGDGQGGVAGPQVAHPGDRHDQRAVSADLVGDPAAVPLKEVCRSRLAVCHSRKANTYSQRWQATRRYQGAGRFARRGAGPPGDDHGRPSAIVGVGRDTSRRRSIR